MITSSDLLFIGSWLFLILFLHLSLLPVFNRFFSKVAVPLSFSISILFFTLVSFWVVFLGLPVQISLVPFLLVGGYFVFLKIRRKKNGSCAAISDDISGYWRYYALFAVVFLSMLILRLYNPDISTAEKFMDHGFIASIMRSPMVPPLDPWFSGGDLSVYYYLGHWMLASLGITAGVPSNILFNLALPTIAAVVAVNLYGVGHLLLPRLRLLPVFFLLLINPAFVQLALAGTEWSKLLWESTRVIDGTINEYPLFSFIFGDVHAHVLGFIPQSTLILLITLTITCWSRMPSVSRLLVILSTALALGSVPPINTWDIFIYAPLIIATGIILLIQDSDERLLSSQKFSSFSIRLQDILDQIRISPSGDSLSRHLSGNRGSFLYLLLVPSLGILCYLPFYLMIHASGVDGIHIVSSPSSINQFLLVNGVFLGILLLSLIPILRKNPWILLIALPFIATGYYAAAIAAILLGALLIRREGVADLMAGIGLVLLVFCEILYMRDSMGDQYFRMNTVFKFYIAAWFLFSSASAYMLGQMLFPVLKKSALIGKLVEGSIVAIILLLLFLPAMVTISHAGAYAPTPDGLAWLTVSHPDDHAAVSWLREQKGNITLVEAEGGDFVYYSRISAFTGIPTLIGWPFHEMLWRNNNPPGWYAKRTTVVRTMYEDPSWCLKLMKMFGIDLLYVGPSERERYNVTLPSTGLDPVYVHGAVTIYKMTGS